jgi:transcriptional regulator with XRE-family HTH domain
MYVSVHALADAISEGGMPLWELAERVGVGVHEIIYVESLRRLPLGVLIRMAQVLGVPTTSLFADTRLDPRPESDTSMVGACIGNRCRGASREALARALGWDLDRVEAALYDLDLRLAELGLHLDQQDGKVTIVGTAGCLTREARIALARNDPGDGAVDEQLARATWSAVFLGDHSMRIRPHDGDVEAYRRKLVIYDGRRMEASEPVAFSLFLADPRR